MAGRHSRRWSKRHSLIHRSFSPRYHRSCLLRLRSDDLSCGMYMERRPLLRYSLSFSYISPLVPQLNTMHDEF